MTQLFESYSTWDHLVGRRERVWFSDTDTKRQQTEPWQPSCSVLLQIAWYSYTRRLVHSNQVGHTKGYTKVVAPHLHENRSLARALHGDVVQTAQVKRNAA